MTANGDNNGNIFLWLLAAIVFAIVALLLTGCKCPCAAIDTSTTDSTEVQVIPRDTVIITAADSASLKALLHCDSAYNVVVDELALLQGDRIDADAHTTHTENGGLFIEFDCKEDSLENIIHLQDSIIKSWHKEVVVKYVEVENKFWKGSGIALWVLIGALVLGAIIGIIIKFAK